MCFDLLENVYRNKSPDPEMSIGVDVHRLLYETVGTVQELASRHDACIVDQDVNRPKLPLHFVRSLKKKTWWINCK